MRGGLRVQGLADALLLHLLTCGMLLTSAMLTKHPAPCCLTLTEASKARHGCQPEYRYCVNRSRISIE